MNSAVRGRLLALAVTVYAAWCAAQFVVARHWISQVDAFNRIEVAHVRALEASRAAAGLPGSMSPVHAAIPLGSSRWIEAGAESAVAMALVLALGTALVLGGRRWWSLTVALIPAAVVVGRFLDGTSVGAVWASLLSNTERWSAIGVAVDTAAVTVIVALLVLAVPREAPALSASNALIRGALPAVILVGWWLIQNPVDADGSRRVWIAQAVVWVLALALLANSSLPVVPKAFVALILAPYMSLTMLEDLVGEPGTTVDTTQFVHHMLVAAGIVAYVAGVPALVKLAQKNRLSRENGSLVQV